MRFTGTLSLMAIWLFMFTTTFYISSCKKDLCKDVNCLNGGVCDDGDCNCLNGYTGTRCEIAPDPCEDVTCQNGGICLEGVCDCATGYEGATCETEVREKFLGTYLMDGNYDCSVSGNMTLTGHPVFIQPGTNILDVIVNIGGATSLSATVNGSSLTIPSQVVNSYTYYGNGTITGNVVVLNVTEFDASVPETCIYSLSGTE